MTDTRLEFTKQIVSSTYLQVQQAQQVPFNTVNKKENESKNNIH